MRQSRGRGKFQPPIYAFRFITGLCLAVLLAATVSGASAASAAPSPGYTASLIQTGVASFWVAVDPATDTVYFANQNARTITVVDGATDAVAATIPLSARPTGVAVDPVTDTIYVPVIPAGSAGAANVDVIDGATNKLSPASIALPTGSAPIGVAVDSSTNTVYVAVAGGVAEIDGTTNSVTTTVSTGSGTRPDQLAVDETSGVVWVADTTGHVFGISGNSVVYTVTLSGVVDSVAVNPADNAVYAATRTSDQVAVIDGATGTVNATIQLTANVYGVAVDPASGTVFASGFSGNGSGTTWIIDDSSNAVTDTLPRGGTQVAINTATGSAYVAAYVLQANGSWLLTRSATNALSPIITSTVATFYTGSSNDVAIAASATPAATFTESGALPAGVTLSPSGILSGSPPASAVGTYTITITASNGVAPDYSQAFTLTVFELPSITAPTSATVHVGVPVSIPLQVAGNPPATTVGLYSDSPPGLTVSETAPGSWQLTGTPAAGSAGLYETIFYATSSAGTAFTTIPITVAGGTSFVSAGPVRVLDTRNGIGHTGVVGPGGAISVQLAGTAGLPATGVTAVVLNVTAVSPTASSYVTVYPDGAARPNASNLNVTAGQTISNLVTVPVGSDGMVDFYNNSGSVNLVADLAGFYTAAGPGSLFVPAGPSRMLDTRNGIGGSTGPVGPGGAITLPVAGVDGVPFSGVTAVVLNVTAVSPTASSYVTVYPDGTNRPNASNLNFTAGQTISNLVVVPVGADGHVDFYNHAGSVNLVADLAGYYVSGSGSSFVPAGPSRMLDTRNAIGHSGAVGPGGTISLQVTGVDGIPASGVTAVVLNVTAVSPTAASYVTVYPDGITRPNASNLNFTAGETIPNLVVVPVGADGKVDFYNNSGSVNLLADLAGYFTSS